MSEIFAAAGSVVEGNAHRERARALREDAKTALAEGYTNEEALRRESRQLFGQAAAAMAEAGSGYSGSNLLLIKQSEVNAELDALNIRYSARRTSRGLRAAARAESAAATSAYLNAGASLLGGSQSGSNTRTLVGV